ncbi:hypothetical protein K435DRAFT_768694 [Dendrothele bispora CBS 962.96]|uniref:Uncharacterized protein n=1 Tax=Dendrothele bispora (strain CBS 962.96) TaxID=1314807 RepID=A0A4S8KUD8_DENBC|nr:hypothetical protein K435DRAFT_768694 [Dendrothele bispora CBS 962.96]
MSPLNPEEVKQAAGAVVSVLVGEGYSCCLFGSLACHIFGMENRDPKDVDLIVLSSNDNVEDLKRLIVNSSSEFFLRNSRNPDATHRILYYRFPTYRPKVCKIDILIAGKKCSPLQIPQPPETWIAYERRAEELPVMPLLALLALKLQGWHDKITSPIEYKQRKAEQDAGDVDQMLQIAVKRHRHLRNKREKWMPTWFKKKIKKFVDKYEYDFPESGGYWRKLGF